MPTITPFAAIRPRPDLAARVASLPYDVYSRAEAAAAAARDPLSFLHIDRADADFPTDVSAYDERVYQRAKELLEARIADGTFVRDDSPCYYIYELTMGSQVNTGIVACSDIADYQQDLIKKHEKTHPEKETDRIRHMEVTNAHSSPVLLTYRADETINEIVAAEKKTPAVYDFTSDDGIRHRVFVIDNQETVGRLQAAFAAVPASYIADGHHRCSSSVKVGLQRQAKNPRHNGTEEYNRFISVLFPGDNLNIMPYYRVVANLNGLTGEGFIEALKRQGFAVEYVGDKAVTPKQRGIYGMYMGNGWYRLTARADMRSDDPVQGLDVEILQEYLLKPVLGIEDPRTDKRIGFVGGIRGLSELERRVATDMAVAFSLYPTSLDEVLRVADAGLLMPPKSTCFEPKPRSGLFIHEMG
ncbi:MAG: DUF1015 family protein [Lachnospiraceae bacterium]|jgi:uncharacterized protein (DUF1015 family)|nr:DUF1015 family protein [Lachnospiraceae bacterium]